jgi:hypothetical protein
MAAFPNFLIIGAAKSGTTALYQYLKQHPQVFMSPLKEPRFFAHENRPPEWGGPGDELYRAATVTDLVAYVGLFHGAGDASAVGEASTQYLYAEKAPECIRRYIPRAKLVAILRNPAEVAHAAFLHKRREGFEPFASFERALAEEDERARAGWSPLWLYRRRGFYHEHLRRYYETFPREQLKVFLHEDFTADPAGVMRELFRFLGVDDSFAPDMSYRPNLSGVPRSRVLYRWLEKSPLRYAPAAPGIGRIKWRAVSGLRSWNLSKPKLAAETRARLLAGYRDDILKLQDLIGRDLSRWLG